MVNYGYGYTKRKDLRFDILDRARVAMSFEKLLETSYLTTQNAGIYRAIMRVFIEEYDKYNYQLFSEEVLSLLQERYPEDFFEYDIDHLKADLEALTEWKNLIPIQDPKRVYTIEEYKNKKYRYFMSEAAVEIERMVMRLENLYIEPASLSVNHFVRIEAALNEIDSLFNKAPKEVSEWWHSLQDDYKVLNQNYTDYLREFYSGKSEKLLKSVEFIIHKDRFVEYLNEFIRQLQIHSTRIAPILLKTSGEKEEALMECIVEGELSIPHPGIDISDEGFRRSMAETVRERWKKLRNFFLPHDGIRSESERILDVTNEIIEKIIRNAALIMQLQNIGISKKNEYKNDIRMFLSCSDIDEAHMLSAHVFGAHGIKHYVSHGERSTDMINSSVFNEDPEDVLIFPHIRNYRPRIEKNGFADKSLDKEAQRIEYLKQVDEEKALADKYIKDGRLLISGINEKVPDRFRIILLSWIAAASANESKVGLTQYGRSFSLIKKEEETVLDCEEIGRAHV